MRFLQISDLHYRKTYPAAKEGYPSIFRQMTPPLKLLQRELEQVDLHGMEFVLICGDLTEYGQEEDYRSLKKQMDAMFGSVPYVVTLGNHDRKEAFYRVWSSTWEPDMEYGSTRHMKGFAVVALDNSSEEDGNGKIKKAHCIWLKKQFQEAARKREKVILMMHHHLLYEEKTPIPTVAYPQEFAEVIRQYHPLAILCGHTHEHRVGVFENSLYATCGSMSFHGCDRRDGEVLFMESASMNLWSVEDTMISVEEIVLPAPEKRLGRVKM